MRIGNAREYEDAAAFLVEIKKRSKQMKEYWKPSKDAAKAAHARICEQEKAMLAPMERAEKTIKAGMARYQTAEAEARREAERKAIKRQQIERDRLMNEAAEAEQLRKELTRLVDFFGQPMFEARFSLAYEEKEYPYHV